MCAGRRPTDIPTCLSQFLFSATHMAPAFRNKGSHTRVRLSVLCSPHPQGFWAARLSHWAWHSHNQHDRKLSLSSREKPKGCSPSPVIPMAVQQAPQRQDTAKKGGRAQVHTYRSGCLLRTPVGRGSGICPVPLGHTCPRSGMAGSHKGLNGTRKGKDRESAGSLPLPILRQCEHPC